MPFAKSSQTFLDFDVIILLKSKLLNPVKFDLIILAIICPQNVDYARCVRYIVCQSNFIFH